MIGELELQLREECAKLANMRVNGLTLGLIEQLKLIIDLTIEKRKLIELPITDELIHKSLNSTFKDAIVLNMYFNEFLNLFSSDVISYIREVNKSDLPMYYIQVGRLLNFLQFKRHHNEAKVELIKSSLNDWIGIAYYGQSQRVVKL